MTRSKKLPLWMKVAMRWHAFREPEARYRINTSISVPSFDPRARGVLVKCNCGKIWAA